RQAVDLERIWPEAFDADPHLLQDRHVLFDPIGIARREFERLRNKKLLRRNSLLFHSASKFFEQDALVRGVLINQHESVGIFHQDIKFIEHADDLELLLSTGLKLFLRIELIASNNFCWWHRRWRGNFN